MYRQNLSERLKYARNKTGFTQREVAKETGISHINIARYENGTREPNVETIGILASFYNVTIDWLFGFVLNNNNETLKQERYIKEINKSIEKEVKEEQKRMAK